MKILSVYPWTHISSSALMINGKIVSGAAEERFNKIKWSTEFPIKSAEWCLKQNNISWDDLDYIAIPWNPAHNIFTSNNRWDSTISWRGQMLSHIPSKIMKARGGLIDSRMETTFGNTKIIYVNHHDCHAASSIYCSPFKECDYLTIDGHGESETCTNGSFKNGKINKKGFVLYPHSVGLFYGAFTDFLGFTPDKDEWKTMALSSYSKNNNIYDKKIKEIYTLTKEGFELDLTYFDYYLFDKKPNFYNKKFIKLFGKERERDSKLLKKDYEIAGALQRAFEKIVFHLLKITKQKGSNKKNIVLSGGAAMNCVFNGLLDKNKIYKNNFVPPWPDDIGVTMGALYLVNSLKNKKKILPSRIRSSYFGPEYKDKEILEALHKYKIKFYKPENLSEFVAKKLVKKKLVGWFQGKMEFAHRALGNRSILADPRSKEAQSIINKAVKYRETFRPFAPAVLEEEVHKIFDVDKNTKIDFMEKAVKVKKEWRNKIPAVTHIDNTARVQTVGKSYNKKFYDLISKFNEISGVPVLVNTSFNLNGQPIVCDPTDAIKTFYSCGLDVLVLGPYIVEK